MDKLKQFSFPVLLGGFFFLYLFTAPHTVQTLDTGGLVRNSYLFSVNHAPGYPLFTWIYGLVTHIPFHDSIFFRASFFTILLALTSLFFLFKRNFLAFLPLFVLLASSKIFWQYAILPDVFALHALLMAMILFFYFKEKEQNFLNDFIVVALFALAATHHQTIIFLAPILMHILIRNKLNIKILAPLTLIPILYTTLLFLDIMDSPFNWRGGKDLESLVNHVLRKNYGTLSLIKGDYRNFFFEYLQFTLIKWKYFILITLMYFLDFRENRKLNIDKRHYMVILSLFFYISIFFNLANLDLYGAGNEIFERFTLTPVILLLGFVMALKPKGIQNKKLAVMVSFAGLSLFVTNIFDNCSRLNFSKNTVMHDWAKARLDTAKDKNSIIISTRDDIFVIRFVRDILEYGGGTPILFDIPFEKYFGRVNKELPNLRDRDHKSASEFFKNNIDNFNFDVDVNFSDHKNFKITVHEVGRTISKGKGLYFAPVKNKDRRIKAFNPKEFNWVDLVGARFCYYYMYKGTYLYSNNKKEEALENFKKATEVVEFCQPAYEKICKLYEEEREKYCPLAIDMHKFKAYFEPYLR